VGVEGSKEARGNLLSSTLAFFFFGTRPPFHTAVIVLYWSFMSIPIAWVVVIVKRAFGERVVVDYELLGYFAAPLGLGALASAAYELTSANRSNPWVSCAVFGAVTGYAFSLLVDMKNNASIGFAIGCFIGGGMAALFVLLRWLILLEAKKRAA
jgi:hypothetical protein